MANSNPPLSRSVNSFSIRSRTSRSCFSPNSPSQGFSISPSAGLRRGSRQPRNFSFRNRFHHFRSESVLLTLFDFCQQPRPYLNGFLPHWRCTNDPLPARPQLASGSLVQCVRKQPLIRLVGLHRDVSPSLQTAQCKLDWRYGSIALLGQALYAQSLVTQHAQRHSRAFVACPRHSSFELIVQLHSKGDQHLREHCR